MQQHRQRDGQNAETRNKVQIISPSWRHQILVKGSFEIPLHPLEFPDTENLPVRTRFGRFAGAVVDAIIGFPTSSSSRTLRMPGSTPGPARLGVKIRDSSPSNSSENGTAVRGLMRGEFAPKKYDGTIIEVYCCDGFGGVVRKEGIDPLGEIGGIRVGLLF